MDYQNTINNKDYNILYNKYKYIFAGLKTRVDCYLLLEKIELNNTEKKILLSIIEGKKMEKMLDFITMSDTISELVNFKYREDVYSIITQLMIKTNNLAQINTFTRIANSKPLRPLNVTIKEQRYKKYIVSKECPHCKQICNADTNVDYIICGYGENGYDWEGCGKDWCFKCGKILCRSWKEDHLFIEDNRCHDMNCCRNHAKHNSKNYPTDYCHCTNKYIRRNISISK